MKKIFLIAGFVFFVFQLRAQQSEKDSIESFKKNDLLVDFRPLTFYSYSYSNDIGIMYRRKIKKVSMRVRVSGSYRDYNRDNGNYYNQSFYVRPSIGIQKNVSLLPTCQFYWGADVFYAYRYNNSLETSNTTETITSSVGFSPLVGIKVLVKKKLVLGIENSGVFSFDSAFKKHRYSDPLLVDNNTQLESFNFNPSNGLRFFIGFNF